MAESASSEPVLLTVQDLTVVYPGRARTPTSPAVANVSFQVKRGQTVALVGESGSGKTTTGRAVLGLVPATGRVQFRGLDILATTDRTRARHRRGAQMIFQDPLASLDPRWNVERIIGEAARVRTDDAPMPPLAELLDDVGLQPEIAHRFPGQLSGGQRQRVAIARALATRPALLVCDEPTSALDVSVAARVIDLLQELQERLDVGYLFISHDLSLVRSLADRVIVMRNGQLVESGPTSQIFTEPEQDYTRALLDAALSYSLDGVGDAS